ncbi:penicillin-binding protein 1C [Ideonella sp. YS5]|uniref:penicillin-binding protein 1C n=1 Tax=Ideonella sp. YS5 TaxID=3453714 RepID=UPI003EEFF583
MLCLGRHRRAVVALGLLVLGLVALRVAPHASLRERVSLSTPLYDRHGTLLRLTLADDQQYRLWTPLERIAPEVIEATLLYEDRSFWLHPGVNPAALVRSAWQMARGGRRQGGSTLTMQLARRLHGLDSSSATGKLQQIAAAIWLEMRYGKRELLEAYLNTAPYGSNIEGVGAASLVYFHHDAARISLPEALALAVIPQNPAQRVASRTAMAATGPTTMATAAPSIAGGNAALEAARGRLWAVWAAAHPDATGAGAPLPRMPALSRGQLPFAAPHLTDMLIGQAAQGTATDTLVREPDGAIHTTLDLPMQRTLERVMAEYLKTRANVGLRNASALLLDASTMEVRAVVGSADYRNADIAGQVNGTLGKRSPGSTLKPFIYALALDQGLLHPRTLLKDAPTSFGPFTPENFDGQFIGPVPAQDALTRSRNVPAVALAARLSQPNLYQFLQLNQVSRLASEAHYGLALVLGGGEVTPEELARLYAVLANGGVSRPLAYTRAQAKASREAPAASPRLISPEAAFITLDMLQQTPRPDTGAPARPAIAWKTGTSWAFRDAWTAGVFGRHVLVVWVGDFEGAGNPAYIGLDAAAPLFLRMVDALRAQRLDPGELPPSRLPDLRRVEVCASTGALPDAQCPARTSTWFIAGKSPIQTQSSQRAVWVDSRSGKALCGPQAASAPHARQVIVESWGSDMQRLFKQAGLPRRQVAGACMDQPPPPEVATGAAMAAAAPGAEAPSISSPLRAVRYLLDPRKPQPLQLRADAAMGMKTLYWFADDSLLGHSAPGESLPWLPPRAGDYLLRVVDEHGRVDIRPIRVELQ